MLTLAEGAGIRNGVADGAVWLNLYAQAPAAPADREVVAAVPVSSRATPD